MEEGISAQDEEDRQQQERLEGDALARAAQAGDREARDALYLRYRQAIRRATGPARRLAAELDRTGSHIEPDDLEGEGFIIFCDLLDRWQPDRAPFVPYMLSAMSMRAYHYVRDANNLRSAKRAVRLASGPDGDDEPHVEREGAQDAASGLDEHEGWEELAGRLSDDWRRLLAMRYGQDLPAKRIALEVGRSERTVHRTLQNALNTLREALALENEAL
ncbi:MAG TPA: sigma-70 family RNA polymerase sigma factor [Chloroflexia bacterium]|nr:sigma-70 family RNA polymerase sigma factor [Chloroflexia bacterium]